MNFSVYAEGSHRAVPESRCGHQFPLRQLKEGLCLFSTDRREVVAKVLDPLPLSEVDEERIDWNAGAGEHRRAAEDLGVRVVDVGSFHCWEFFVSERLLHSNAFNPFRILQGSGLVGGEGLIGVVIAGAAGYAVSRGQIPWRLGYEWAGALAPWLAFALFVGLIAYFWRLVVKQASV